MWIVLAFIFSNLFSIVLFYVMGFLRGFTECSKGTKEKQNEQAEG